MIDDGVLAGGANWGCYGSSLVPVLPQAPGGAQHPQHPLRYGPELEAKCYLVRHPPATFSTKSATVCVVHMSNIKLLFHNESHS